MKRDVLVIILSIVTVAAAVGLFAHFFQGEDVLDISTNEVVEKGTDDARTPPPGHKEYRNQRYGFSVFLPEKMIVRMVDEGLGAATISFEDFEAENGYQIFIVPHTETTITEERFLADVPSGVRENIVPASIHGVESVTFDSTNVLLGDTFEFWFIHYGYVYEVTTFREQKEWLLEQLATWEFIPIKEYFPEEKPGS
jgi:hypothetical protein